MKEKDFDCYQRYNALKGVLEAAFPLKLNTDGVKKTILDVGAGESTLTSDFLGSAFQIVRADVIPIDDPDAVLIKAGQKLPFADHAFDIVVAMDVMEHVKAESRALLIEECLRVSRHMCILAVPNCTPELKEAEKRVNDIYEHYFGTHKFLSEHLEYSCPTREEMRNCLSKEGVSLIELANVPLHLWEIFSSLDFIAYSNKKTLQMTIDIHLLENNSFAPSFNKGLHYRCFYIACKSQQTAKLVHTHVKSHEEEPNPNELQSIFLPICQLIAAQYNSNSIEIQKKDSAIALLNDQLAARDSEIIILNDQLAARDQELLRIKSSIPWRLLRLAKRVLRR